MTETNVFQLSQPGSFFDPLTEVLRDGARALLAQAVEAEVAALLSRYADETSNDGRQRLVRHGHLPERKIMTGIGPVAVRCPRVRDRVGEGSERIRFSSAILPPYAPIKEPRDAGNARRGRGCSPARCWCGAAAGRRAAPARGRRNGPGARAHSCPRRSPRARAMDLRTNAAI